MFQKLNKPIELLLLQFRVLRFKDGSQCWPKKSQFVKQLNNFNFTTFPN